MFDTDYDVCGDVRASTGVSSLFAYTGEHHDPTTGFTHLRARDDDPGTGRFTARDIVQPNAAGSQGYNRYAYAANNPTTWTDPTGHQVTGEVLVPTLKLNWIAIGIAIGLTFVAQACAIQPMVCTTSLGDLAIFVIVALAVAACVIEVGGPCWTWQTVYFDAPSIKWPLSTTPESTQDVPNGGAQLVPTPSVDASKPFRHPSWDDIREIGRKYGKKCWTLGDFIYFLDTSPHHFDGPHMEVWSKNGRKPWLGEVPMNGGKVHYNAKKAKQGRNVDQACGR